MELGDSAFSCEKIDSACRKERATEISSDSGHSTKAAPTTLQRSEGFDSPKSYTLWLSGLSSKLKFSKTQKLVETCENLAFGR